MVQVDVPKKLSRKAKKLLEQLSDELREPAGYHAAWHPAVQWEGLLAGEPYTNQDFQEDFKAKFGRDGDEDEAIPFALCQGIEQAVRATGSTDNAELVAWLAARTAANSQSPVTSLNGNSSSSLPAS